MMNKDHTIAILGYNNHEITLQNIDHLRSTGCEDTILFWDNGSVPSYEGELSKRTNIEFIRKEENQFVNPVWNELIKTCKTKYITLLNNDCFLLSYTYFDEILPNMRKNDIALSSVKTVRAPKMPKQLTPSLWQKFQEKRPLKLKTKVRRQGWIMTLDVEQYRAQTEYLIPEELKIWFGDDWIWHVAAHNNLKYGVYSNRYALHLDFPVTMTSKIASIIQADEEALNNNRSWYDESSPKIHIKTRLFSRYA